MLKSDIGKNCLNPFKRIIILAVVPIDKAQTVYAGHARLSSEQLLQNTKNAPR